jgi:tripartite-type tricarboxylate transporter receptor subunit TctC
MGAFSRHLTTLTSGILMSLSACAFAQSYPSAPITMVVPYPPGNSTDLLCRIVMKGLADRINQPVIVANRPGAGGTIGSKFVQTSAPNGYTIGLIASGHAIQPWLDRAMPFDVRKDFTQLNLIYTGQYLLLVPSAVPARNLQEFASFARANPAKMFYGSSGQGTTTHLGGELIKQVARFEMTHIPYKGSTEVLQAAMAGDIQAYLDLLGTAEPHLKSGKLRAIATLGPKRRPNLPDVPALAETYPGMEVQAWTVLVAPPGLAKEITDKLVGELSQVFANPEVRQKFIELGVDPGGLAGPDLAKFVSSEYERWGKVITTAGLKPQ